MGMRRVVVWLQLHCRRAGRWVLLLPCLVLLLLRNTATFDKGGGEGVGGVRAGGEERDALRGSAIYKFRDFSADEWNSSQRMVLGEDTGEYFRTVGSVKCYVLGTDWGRTGPHEGCVCVGGYHGPHCGIPECAWASYYRQHSDSVPSLTPRSTPRRVIHGLQVNHEFQLFEARVSSLSSLVDVYLLLESNYSSYGSPKPLSFLTRLQGGWLAKHQANLLYILLPFFPKAGETNGWYADSFLRLYLGKAGMKLIDGLRDDDIFLLLDADELPTAEALLFLKLFDGWKEPVRFGFRWTVFGFFWLKAADPSWLESLPLVDQLVQLVGGQRKERLLELYTVCTVGMLREVYGNNAMLLRRNVWSHSLLSGRLKNYTRHHTAPQEWLLGSSPHYAGHHCSWCYTTQGIVTKLTSAQRHDKPRWGDFPEKLELPYLQSLIREGAWFDGEKPFLPVDRGEVGEEVYAPKYFLDREEEFSYLLERPLETP